MSDILPHPAHTAGCTYPHIRHIQQGAHTPPEDHNGENSTHPRTITVRTVPTRGYSRVHIPTRRYSRVHIPHPRTNNGERYPRTNNGERYPDTMVGIVPGAPWWVVYLPGRVPPYHPGYIPYYTTLGIPSMLHAPRWVPSVCTVASVRDSGFLGSILGIIREMRRIERLLFPRV